MPIHATFFFNDTATTEIYTLSLHDALPICRFAMRALRLALALVSPALTGGAMLAAQTVERTDVPDRGMIRFTFDPRRSEEHTPELQSQPKLFSPLLL